MRFDRWRYILPLRLRSLFSGADADRELDDELHDHVERQTEANIARGMTAAAARTAALRAVGGIEQRKEECRDQRGVSIIENLVRDLRLALRQLRKQPAFTIAAVVSLALGIGGNTAIFQLLNALSLRPLPVTAPHELVEVRLTRTRPRRPAHRTQQPVFAAAVPGTAAPAAGVLVDAGVRGHAVQPRAVGRGALRRRPVGVRIVLRDAGRDARGRPVDHTGGRSTGLRLSRRGDQRRALAPRIRRPAGCRRPVDPVRPGTRADPRRGAAGVLRCRSRAAASTSRCRSARPATIAATTGGSASSVASSRDGPGRRRWRTCRAFCPMCSGKRCRPRSAPLPSPTTSRCAWSRTMRARACRRGRREPA